MSFYFVRFPKQQPSLKQFPHWVMKMDDGLRPQSAQQASGYFSTPDALGADRIALLAVHFRDETLFTAKIRDVNQGHVDKS